MTRRMIREGDSYMNLTAEVDEFGGRGSEVRELKKKGTAKSIIIIYNTEFGGIIENARRPPAIAELSPTKVK
jgi:hypothetical protein